MADFYRCNFCGNLITKLEDGGVTPFCCGEEMEVLQASMTDGAKEKHVPVIQTKILETNCKDSKELCQITVCIGSDPHPMDKAHYIQWIVLETKNGLCYQKLKPGDEPQAVFYLPKDAGIEAVYSYCNLHGLWMK